MPDTGSIDNPVKKVRRPRYKGKNPGRFELKYKELNPSLYPQEVEKILLSGKTPAGTHRPVLVREILEAFQPRPGHFVLDATLGYGGHASEILKLITPGGCLWGIDADPIEITRTEARLRSMGYNDQEFKVRRMNYAGAGKLLAESGGGFDLILADLGVSSMQLDDPARGFTFKREGPLDLRLNPTRGKPAFELLQSFTKTGLEIILRDYSDEPYAAQIARALGGSRGKVTTTSALAEAVRQALQGAVPGLRPDQINRSIRRTFQALRIAVNDEFFVLEQFLKNLPSCLKSGAKAGVLTFHSGEELRVSRSFKEGFDAGVYIDQNSHPIHASPLECHANPRSASASFHWVQKAHLTLILFIIFNPALAGADNLLLKNGHNVEGIIISESDRSLTINVGGGTIDFTKDEVRTVTHSDPDETEGLYARWRVKRKELAKEEAMAQAERAKAMDLWRQQSARREALQVERLDHQRNYNADTKAVPVSAANGHVWAEVSINGNTPGILMVDTGSPTVLLTMGFIKKLNLTPADLRYVSKISVLNGVHSAAYVVLKSLKIGDVEEVNIPAMILLEPDDHLEKGFHDGLMGLSFLNRFHVTLDQSNGRLLLHPVALKNAQ